MLYCIFFFSVKGLISPSFNSFALVQERGKKNQLIAMKGSDNFHDNINSFKIRLRSSE